MLLGRRGRTGNFKEQLWGTQPTHAAPLLFYGKNASRCSLSQFFSIICNFILISFPLSPRIPHTASSCQLMPQTKCVLHVVSCIMSTYFFSCSALVCLLFRCFFFCVRASRNFKPWISAAVAGAFFVLFRWEIIFAGAVIHWMISIKAFKLKCIKGVVRKLRNNRNPLKRFKRKAISTLIMTFFGRVILKCHLDSSNHLLYVIYQQSLILTRNAAQEEEPKHWGRRRAHKLCEWRGGKLQKDCANVGTGRREAAEASREDEGEKEKIQTVERRKATAQDIVNFSSWAWMRRGWFHFLNGIIPSFVAGMKQSPFAHLVVSFSTGFSACLPVYAFPRWVRTTSHNTAQKRKDEKGVSSRWSFLQVEQRAELTIT